MIDVLQGPSLRIAMPDGCSVDALNVLTNSLNSSAIPVRVQPSRNAFECQDAILRLSDIAPVVREIAPLPSSRLPGLPLPRSARATASRSRNRHAGRGSVHIIPAQVCPVRHRSRYRRRILRHPRRCRRARRGASAARHLERLDPTHCDERKLGVL
jgi:hypothetical protein